MADEGSSVGMEGAPAPVARPAQAELDRGALREEGPAHLAGVRAALPTEAGEVRRPLSLQAFFTSTSSPSLSLLLTRLCTAGWDLASWWVKTDIAGGPPLHRDPHLQVGKRHPKVSS